MSRKTRVVLLLGQGVVNLVQVFNSRVGKTSPDLNISTTIFHCLFDTMLYHSLSISSIDFIPMNLKLFSCYTPAAPMWTGVCVFGCFSLVKSDSGLFSLLVRFVWAGVNTVIALSCWSKQQHQDPLEEVVSVRSQMNSAALNLWWEHDPTSIRPSYQVYSASLS